MNVFDILIHNTDRTQENALFTKDWTLVLIDHTRAFPALVKNPTLLYKGEPVVPPALAARLATLNEEMLTKALTPYLQKRQITSLLKRRDLLLKDYTARSTADGDDPLKVRGREPAASRIDGNATSVQALRSCACRDIQAVPRVPVCALCRVGECRGLPRGQDAGSGPHPASTTGERFARDAARARRAAADCSVTARHGMWSTRAQTSRSVC